MKNSKEKCTKPKAELQTSQPSNATETTPLQDSSSISPSSNNENRKVSREDIELVQNLIERCLLLYMNRDEVVKTLLNRAKIDPGFTTLVWKKLEEENADFFRAYYIRIKLKKQIILFNHLLEHQCNVMKHPMMMITPKVLPLAPMPPNGINAMPVHNLPVGYPLLQHPPFHASGQPQFDPMSAYSMAHVVDGVPAPSNFHTIMAIDNSITSDVAMMQTNNVMSGLSDIALSPPNSVTSSGHFPFNGSEMSGPCVDTANLDAEFTHDVASSVGLEFQQDNEAAGSSRDPLLTHMNWNFSISDVDLSNFADLEALGNYPGSPFLPSNSDLLLDSPEHEGIVEEFFVDSDSIPGQNQPSDEEKS